MKGMALYRSAFTTWSECWNLVVSKNDPIGLISCCLRIEQLLSSKLQGRNHSHSYLLTGPAFHYNHGPLESLPPLLLYFTFVLLTSHCSVFGITLEVTSHFLSLTSRRWTECPCCFCHGSAASLASTRPPTSGVRSPNDSENTNERGNICRPPISFR